MPNQPVPYVFSFRLFRNKLRLRPLKLSALRLAWPWRNISNQAVCIGWGNKPSGRRAERAAKQYQVPLMLVEDGFLRSYGLGVSGSPPLSLVVDNTGIYYDATRPSRLEHLLEAGNFPPAVLTQAKQALTWIQQKGLSKYNHGRSVTANWFNTIAQNNTGITGKRILVIDQTAGDASIHYGMGNTRLFGEMLEAAIRENPEAEIWVKTHPDVLAGKKASPLAHARNTSGIYWIHEDWHPHSLLKHFDHVYVVTSQMGFDALLLGKPVTCFGIPFYAGWGLTDDRQSCPRRTAKRTLVELVASAYLQYAHYIKPETGERGTFFDVARFISRQKNMAQFWNAPSFRTSTENTQGMPWSGRVFCFGFRYWKHAHVRPFFGEGVRLSFVGSVLEALRKGINSTDRIAVWGQKNISGLQDLANSLNTDLIRVEDGFLRSVGLGADFIPPMSLVFDRRGIYFDPTANSDLEHILNHTDFHPELVGRAQYVRARICEERLTKYNNEGSIPLILAHQGRKVILVPGQVEDDASILKGAGTIRTNMGLLQAVRDANPHAFIIYKPHPDVLARNRRGHVDMTPLRNICDHVETVTDIIRCIESCDEVHTMTSLTGFDALLRSKQVVTYGAPFYAGWGLTQDHLSLPNRQRQLTLDELVAGALLLYPRYWDAQSAGFVECETIIERLLKQRQRHIDSPFSALPKGVRRQTRKWSSFARGVWDAWRLPSK
jgi:capsular polysaccharide export protein